MQGKKKSINLNLIRLEAESLNNQLYFLREALSGLARETASGPQLYPLAIRGLCSQLKKMEDDASSIFCRACDLLGVGEDIVAEEWS